MKETRFSKIITANFSDTEQSTLNIAGALIVVIINACINFFLSPFITEHLGVEANGYITLANSFISYFGLITTALDSMAGRFMLIAIRRNDFVEANEYYSSVLFGDWMLAVTLFAPALAFIIKIDDFIQVNAVMLTDIKILFTLVFLSFFFSLCLPKWANATYSTNRLYLRSIKVAATTIIRAFLIYIAYKCLPAYAFYVALAGYVSNIISVLIEYKYKTILLPDLHVRRRYFNWKRVKMLVASGIWNTVSQCGNILLEGLDVLLANLFINPVMSGVLSLSKIIPSMINQIVGTIGTTFGPRVTALYSDNNYIEMAEEIKTHIKIVSTIANVLIGGTFVLGVQFFGLWVPSENAKQLSILASLSLIGLLFSGVSNCILNVFIAANKLKLNSIMVIISGLVNILIMYVLLQTTDLGVYIIAGVSSLISILRIFLFTAPYAARCINQELFTFIIPLLKAGVNVLIPVAVGCIIRLMPGDDWLMFLIKCIIIGILSFVIDYFAVLNAGEREKVMQLIRKK